MSIDTAQNDKAVVARIHGGDVEAYAHLVGRYQGPLLVFVFNLVRDRHLAQDLAQDVFLKAYQSIRNYEARDHIAFSTWLFCIAKNTCLDSLRSGKWKHEAIDERDSVFQMDPPQRDHVDGNRFREVLQKSLDKLALDQRMAFDLILVQGLSYEEAAQVMDCSVGTIKSRVHTARQNLQGRLRQFVDKE